MVGEWGLPRVTVKKGELWRLSRPFVPEVAAAADGAAAAEAPAPAAAPPPEPAASSAPKRKSKKKSVRETMAAAARAATRPPPPPTVPGTEQHLLEFMSRDESADDDAPRAGTDAESVSGGGGGGPAEAWEDGTGREAEEEAEGEAAAAPGSSADPWSASSVEAVVREPRDACLLSVRRRRRRTKGGRGKRAPANGGAGGGGGEDEAPDDGVYLSELAVWATGKYQQTSPGFFIYWHRHSQLIHLLTGVSYCLKLYVQCGRDLGQGLVEVFSVPRLYIVRMADEYNDYPAIYAPFQPDSPVFDTYASLPICWPCGVDAMWSEALGLELVRHQQRRGSWIVVQPRGCLLGFPEAHPRRPRPVGVAPAAAAEAATADDGEARPPALPPPMHDALWREWVSGAAGAFDLSRRLQLLRAGAETGHFRRRLSICVQQLRQYVRGVVPPHRARLTRRFMEQAQYKRLHLLPVNGADSFVLSQMCLYALGEPSLVEDVVGAMHSDRVEGDPEFREHHVVFSVACELSMLLEALYRQRDHIAAPNQRWMAADARIWAMAHEMALMYYQDTVDVTLPVVAVAARVFYEVMLRSQRLCEAGARESVLETAIETIRPLVPSLHAVPMRQGVIKLLCL